MSETTTTSLPDNFAAVGLTDLIRAALPTIPSDGQRLTVGQLAPPDQFHIRGLRATQELARAALSDRLTFQAADALDLPFGDCSTCQ